MEAVAQARATQFHQQHTDVAVENTPEHRVVLQFLSKGLRCQAPGQTAALNERSQRCALNTQRQFVAQGALVAHQACLQAVVAVRRGNQRNKGARGEVDVVDGIARLVERLGRCQWHALAFFEQTRPDHRRQHFEQTVVNGAGRMGCHRAPVERGQRENA
ncbi:hypothetical protein D3C87_1416200 [compost metagenome]